MSPGLKNVRLFTFHLLTIGFVTPSFGQNEELIRVFSQRERLVLANHYGIESADHVAGEFKSDKIGFRPDIWMMSFYRAWLSPRFSAECTFSPSCSRFTAAMIGRKGFVIGVMAGFDRLSRCHVHAGTGLHYMHFQPDKSIIIDDPEDY